MADLRTGAFELLQRNTMRGCMASGDEYVYTCPARGVYHYQWLWDSCFHAYVLARFDGELAKAELRTLLSSQLPHGLLPHVIAWQQNSRPGWRGRLTRWLWGRSHFANLTQPPVVALAVEEVYRRTGDLQFVRESLPAVKRYYDHLAATRDPDGDELLSIISPLESGMDHSPSFDAALALGRISALDYHLASVKLTLACALLGWRSERILAADRFSVEDVSFNTVYALGLRSLSGLCRVADDPEAATYMARALATESALVSRCYDEETGLFYSLHTKADLPLPVATVGSLLPLALPSLPAEIARRLVEKHLLREDSFWLPYPVPSVSAADPTFSADSLPLRQRGGGAAWVRNRFARHHLIWRGSTWINTNWFLFHGLRLHRYDEVAETLAAATAEMVEKNGFWEYYNPYTGAGQGAQNFGWSTLVVDMIDQVPAERLARARQRSRPGLPEFVPQPAGMRLVLE
ncbi:MAG: MGH1-like glycoside hydrolase domain-containing protein [Chloroflexota bacterium]